MPVFDNVNINVVNVITRDKLWFIFSKGEEAIAVDDLLVE